MVLRAIWLALVLMALVRPPFARAEEPVARLLLFYSERCSSCQAIEREVLQPLRAKYGGQLEIRAFELSDPANYALMLRLEDRYQLTKPEIPEVFIDGRALVGEKEVRDELDLAIAACLARDGCEYPATEFPGATSGPSSGGAPIHLAYFLTPGCSACDRVSYDLAYLKSKFPGLAVTTFDMTAPASKTLNEAMGRRLGVPESQRLLTPAVFVGRDYLIGDQIQAPNLAAVLASYAEPGAVAVWEELSAEQRQAERGIAERFLSFGLASVLAAGLIDGLNPCAFATVIFFVSYMAVAGRKGREIIFVGGAFTLGVFLAYLLIGLGLLSALGSLAFLTAVTKVLYLVTAVTCLVFAALNARDFLRIQRGGLAEMGLQLPGFLKERVRRTIREGARVRRYVLAAFVSGFVISLYEVVCTGQIYLPTLVFVAGVPELRAQATLYLVLYNLAFILPLVVVFLLAYFGTTSKDLTRFLQRRAGLVKLLMAAVFVVLGGWMVYVSL